MNAFCTELDPCAKSFTCLAVQLAVGQILEGLVGHRQRNIGLGLRGAVQDQQRLRLLLNASYSSFLPAQHQRLPDNIAQHLLQVDLPGQAMPQGGLRTVQVSSLPASFFSLISCLSQKEAEPDIDLQRCHSSS